MFVDLLVPYEIRKCDQEILAEARTLKYFKPISSFRYQWAILSVQHKSWSAVCDVRRLVYTINTT